MMLKCEKPPNPENTLLWNEHEAKVLFLQRRSPRVRNHLDAREGEDIWRIRTASTDPHFERPFSNAIFPPMEQRGAGGVWVWRKVIKAFAIVPRSVSLKILPETPEAVLGPRFILRLLFRFTWRISKVNLIRFQRCRYF